MLKQVADRYWAWRRRHAERTLEQAYLRTAPKGQEPSEDSAIDAYYARLREEPATLSPRQLAAMRVQEQTIARAKDPPPGAKDQHFVEDRSDHQGGGNIGHFDEPTVKVSVMLPPMKGKDE